MAQFAVCRNSLCVMAILILFGGEITHAQTKLIRYEDSRVSMACTYAIAVYGEDEQQLQKIVSEAFDEVDRIDRLMSHYKKESPLSLINSEAAAEQPVKTDPELFSFLVECQKYSRISAGAFDITVGPLMKSWGFFRGEGRMPADAELRKVRQKIGYQKLKLDEKNRTVEFLRAGMELDLGGIAKGYAVDRVVKILKKHQITKALISAGGSTIYALGAPPEKPAWEVQIQDPLDARKIALTVLLKNQALSISGSAEKFFELDGKRYSHIMNPRTGKPVMNMLSVAVITKTGTAGDALDNIFYVAGVQKSRMYLRQFPSTEIFFFLPDAPKKYRLIKLKN